MLKKDITYEDFNGDTITESFYFNLTKPELLELEVDFEGGIGQEIEKATKENNNKALLYTFKRIVLASYGEKSPDGKRFVKSEELSAGFSQTNAYAELFMQLAQDEDAAASFIKGVLPKDLSSQLDQDKPTVTLGDISTASTTPTNPPELTQ